MKRLRRIGKIFMITTSSLLVLLGIATFVFMQHPKFGKAPSGERLARIQQSPNFKKGKFQNLSPTPTLAEGYTFWGEIYKLIFRKGNPRRYPTDNIPTMKEDLLHLPADTNVLVWFGHSSYFMQVNGKTFLMDPVFSGNASPIPNSVKAFKGTDVYTAADLPPIDYLLISHDHYDHLDYETALQLREKVRHVVCGLGVGAHFEYWGYSKEKILEKDWHEQVDLGNGSIIYTQPARHKSGRGFSQDNTLWMSYVLQSPGFTIFMGGDSGYGKHFAAIGQQFGGIDLAILENGQYDHAWHYVHTLPEEVLMAAHDLKAKRLFPVHSSKFVLAKHSWDEPLRKLKALNKAGDHLPLVTPVIGQIVYLQDTTQVFKSWWEGLQ